MLRSNCSRGCCLVDNRAAEKRRVQEQIDAETGKYDDNEYEYEYNER